VDFGLVSGMGYMPVLPQRGHFGVISRVYGYPGRAGFFGFPAMGFVISSTRETPGPARCYAAPVPGLRVRIRGRLRPRLAGLWRPG
jgi:hypothetical protein